MLRPAPTRALGEFIVVTGFNAATLGGALVLLGRAAGLGAVTTVLCAHACSAVLSLAFCRVAVWRVPFRGAVAEWRAAAGFLGLAGISALSGAGATAAFHSERRSAWFVLLNYGAVGTITVGKFVLQRALLRRNGPHGLGPPQAAAATA